MKTLKAVKRLFARSNRRPHATHPAAAGAEHEGAAAAGLFAAEGAKKAKRNGSGGGGSRKARVAPYLEHSSGAEHFSAAPEKAHKGPVALLPEQIEAVRAGNVPVSLLRVGFEHLPGESKAARTALDAAAEEAGAFEDETVRMAVEHFETGQMNRGFDLLHRAVEKGAPLAVFLFGVSLMHGWGCNPDPSRAVTYLRRAAESSALELDQQLKRSKEYPERGTSGATSAQSELALAVYELGISFALGLGVTKNERIAAYYFEIAALLGDPDAQNDVARMYENGVGVKRDMHKAAAYYRTAAAQGHGTFGNAWIYKDKYGGLVPMS